MMFESRFQIGKNGLTEGVIDSLNLSLKTHDQIRISVLKSSERDKQKVLEMANEIVKKINYHCNYKIIGFTIILKKRSSKPKKILKEKSL
ncbi:MAG: YhbY family RNA-binding protein [Nanoarchaeota archaeon]|nr:YhbY family RNA-binding protein [Nanoarchaeota archaeon]